MLKSELPEDLPTVFISSVSQIGLTELKDVLWEELNSESNKLQRIIGDENLVHRDKDINTLNATDFDDDIEYEDCDEDSEDFEYIE